MEDFLDRLGDMTPMDMVAYSLAHPAPPPPPPPEPPFTPPPGFTLRLERYCAGHGDYRSHWVVEETS